MTSEQPPRDTLRPLRPLPSIDIPLLREERSAVRNRRLVRLAIAGALLAVFGACAAFARRYYNEPAPQASAGIATAAASATSEEADPQAPTPDPGAALAADGTAAQPDGPEPPGSARAPNEEEALLGNAAVEPEPAPHAAGRYERSFGKAGSFSDALIKAGLDRDEADEVVTALTGKLDFRRAQPEDVLVIERGGQGRLERVEFRAAPTLRYEAMRAPEGGLVGRQVELAIEKVRLARGGLVEGSLGDALEGLKLGRALTGVFADLFASKVNFSTATRRGDSFRVLLEEERVEGAFLRYSTIDALEYRGEKTGPLRAFWYESPQSEGDFYDERGRALHGGWLRTPLRYDHISSGFGMRMHPVLKRKLLHNGIDYCAPSGTPVHAAAGGTVRIAGRKGVNGNLVALQHERDYETFYAHLSRFAPGIKPGVRVKQRQLIGYVGSTGRSTGPHLHFALKRSGRFVDPNSQLNGPGLPLAARELGAYKQRVRALLDQLAEIPLEQPRPVPAAAVAAPNLDFADEDEL